MLVSDLLEAGASVAWKKPGGSKTHKVVRKYRCTSGPRKGQMRASPASCNAPYKFKSGVNLRKTKAKLGSHGTFISGRTKKYNPGSRRVAKLNKPARRKSMR